MIRLPTSAIVWWGVVSGLLAVALVAGWVEPSVGTLGLVLLCAACEMVDSTLGMGYGTTLTPILLLFGFDPLVLVPAVLVSELVSGFAAGLFHAEAGNISLAPGSQHRRAVVILSLGSLVGAVGGVELALSVSRQTLVTLISLIVLGAGLFILLRSNRPMAYRTWKIVLLGGVASFNKAVSGGGYGPLMTSGQILSGVAGRSAVGITSLAEGFTCLAATALFLLEGVRLEPAVVIPVSAGALLSVPVAAQVVRHVTEVRMRKTIAVATITLGMVSLIKVLLG